ncbi:MAG: hypothetical protein JJU00_13060 [Opitutales bacterium]|nr:hypothetical protein [Opitutales bacterium]
MADLPEDAGFVEAVTQLETTDPVLGGPGGKSNEAHAQLASRTRWLRDLLEALAIRDAVVTGGDADSGWDVQALSTNFDWSTSEAFTIAAAPFARRGVIAYRFEVDKIEALPLGIEHRLADASSAGLTPVDFAGAEENDEDRAVVQRHSVVVDIPPGAAFTLRAQARRASPAGSYSGSNNLLPVRWTAALSFDPA